MLNDPDVFAALMLLALMALNEKLLITPAITETTLEDNPAADTATPAATTEGTTTDTSPKDNIPTENAVDATTAPVKKPTNPKVELAKEIADFCQRQVDRVAKFQAIIFAMVFEGMAHGNKVAEQTLEVAARGI